MPEALGNVLPLLPKLSNLTQVAKTFNELLTMKKIAIFPGSFDPFTIGHEAIVKRAIPIFDQIIISIGHNITKKSFFSEKKRKELIEKIFEQEKIVSVEIYEGLTVQFCKKRNAKYILRGLRTSADFEYERPIAQINKILAPDIETVYLLTSPEHSSISSSIVKEILKYQGDVSKFVPQIIKEELNNE